MIALNREDRFIIAGGSSGIGLACGLDLHRRGATVLLIARREEELQRIRSVSSDPARIIPVVRDLSVDLAGVPAFVDDLARSHGAFRGLVCAAGVLSNAPLRALHLPTARSVLELNALSSVQMVTAFARVSVCAPRAAVVLISSLSSLRGLTGAGVYSASKGALDSLCRSAAAELAPQAIRVNAILPGVVETPMTAAVPSEQLSWMTDLQLIPGRIMPSDVADLTTFLLSDLAAFITGQCIVADGGVGLSLKSHRAVTSTSSTAKVAPL